MYRKFTLIVILLTSQFIFSQELKECEKIAQKTFESLNKKSVVDITPYLSEGFSISGYKGTVAKAVLKQLVLKLGNVSGYKLTSQNKEDSRLTLNYDVTYSFGTKQAKFVFNSSNEILALELIKVQVKTLNSKKTVINYNKKDVIEIPFTQMGKLIVVKAKLNGIERNFILDSGAPSIILNSKYLGDEKVRSFTDSNGANGAISGADIKKANIDFYGTVLKKQDVLTHDLSHLEKSMNIYGLIGYSFLKEYDVLINYDKRLLTLINPSYTDKKIQGKKFTTIPFELENHIPVITIKTSRKNYKMGIDSGAESNLMDKSLFNYMKKKSIKIDTLTGADKRNRKEVKSALIKRICVADKKYKNLKTIFSDISHLNKKRKIKIDGLLGYPFLSKQSTLFRFKRKELLLFK